MGENDEHELSNGYNSGDEYTGRTNLTATEWQEVRKFFNNFTINNIN